jgi:hypothetical protein
VQGLVLQTLEAHVQMVVDITAPPQAPPSELTNPVTSEEVLAQEPGGAFPQSGAI